MRLLHVRTLKSVEFFGANIPPYAILSHRWGDSEVTFQDVETGSGTDKRGWQKIKCCCKRAAKDGWDYVWIDSCCIDKTNSTELLEAINSMFRWYQDARVCYAYLSDVLPGDGSPSQPKSSFRESRWFTRGWTLQELLAPEVVIFFDCEWAEIGTKLGLHKTISSITGIKHLSEFRKACIAQKMSWASGRETLRPEDMAYCLLGLFGVNMPLLYGEGENAFIRLQIEIMRISDDESIFAWTDKDLRSSRSGLLARSPLAFKDSGDIELGSNTIRRSAPYSMTNKGLQISLGVILPSAVTPSQGFSSTQDPYLAPLNCFREGTEDAVVLELAKHSHHVDEYSRISCDRLLAAKYMTNRSRAERTIFIRQELGVEFRIWKPTMITISGARCGDEESALTLSSDSLYPGLFDSDHFIFHYGGKGLSFETHRRIFKAADGSSILMIELDPGIVMLSCRIGETSFGLEIDSPRQRTPTIGLLLPQPSQSLTEMIDTRLTEPVLRLTEDLASGVVWSGELVTASLTREPGLNQLFFTIRITIAEQEPQVETSSRNVER